MRQEPSEIFAMLSVIRVNRAYRNAAEKERYESMEIAPDDLEAIRPKSYDWGYEKYSDTASVALDNGKPIKNIPKVKTPFKSGDLVRVFKTVTDGDLLWAGNIDLVRRKDYLIGEQKGFERGKWSSIFFDGMPVKLEREGKTIFGCAHLYQAQGEGVSWAVQEYGDFGYGGLYLLNSGDHLTVYKNVRDGEIEWEGVLDFDMEEHSYINWGDMRQDVHRMPKHTDPVLWLAMNYQRRPVAITPAAKMSKEL